MYSQTHTKAKKNKTKSLIWVPFFHHPTRKCIRPNSTAPSMHTEPVEAQNSKLVV